jgi:hypothetical protein
MTDTRHRQAPVLEVQIHPGRVRWGVRYLFLSRRHLGWLGAALVGLVAFLIFGLAVTPAVVANLFRLHEYRSLLHERARQGGRVQSLGGELEDLVERSDLLRVRMERVFLTYGMSASLSLGQGGFPFETGEGFDSIYAVSVRQGRRLENLLNEELAVLDTFISEVESFEAAHREQVDTTPSLSPLAADTFVLTSPFGTRRSPFTKRMDLHPGIDLAAQLGTPITAPAAGVVVFAGRYPIRQSVSWWRYGNLVAIRHGELFITLFGHCEEIRVRTGEAVEQRQVIATVGNTGWSTSPHLHYEVRRLEEDAEFVPVDPRIYILDYRWRDEERLLVRGRGAPDLSSYEPLPGLIGR